MLLQSSHHLIDCPVPSSRLGCSRFGTAFGLGLCLPRVDDSVCLGPPQRVEGLLHARVTVYTIPLRRAYRYSHIIRVKRGGRQDEREQYAHFNDYMEYMQWSCSHGIFVTQKSPFIRAMGSEGGPGRQGSRGSGRR